MKLRLEPLCGKQSGPAGLGPRLAQRTARPRDPGQRPDPGQVGTAKQEELFDEATKAAFESLIPRGTMGRPEEIATVALFLASDDSSYVNGLELVADGGTTAI
ncbi:SDR family oxidoreductase [Actinomadura sp. 1N219]|uniref:SDR family oxidoreductase n=1 Tax=Actinomadura sp. 1N219 TaxID=3375152 RepID=UPI0037B0A12A